MSPAYGQLAVPSLPARAAARPRHRYPSIAERLRERWLDLLCLLLLGYAVFGKGFAYLGIPPVFVGEIALLLGFVVFPFSRRCRCLFNSRLAWLILLLMLWGAIRTIPYIREFGADALRDAAIWGYATFALLTFAFLVYDPTRLSHLLVKYGWFAVVFPAVIPLIWVLTQFAGDAVPRLPWGDVPVVHAKGGDILVHLAGIFAFWVTLWNRSGRLVPLLLAANVMLVGIYNRGGLVSFLAVFGLCFFLKPQARPLWRLAGLASLAVLLMAVTDLRVAVPGKNREVSFSQLVENLVSVAGESSAGELDGTKQWRLQWWGDIVDYTVRGKYFWTGKGFGINLADVDGYQGLRWEGRLRSPHNGHLSMLARAGVPGFVLWVVVQLSWGFAMLSRHFQARDAGQRRWAGLFLFLLAYWLAFMANASFDVFVEGPMGGIWFWTLYGVGMAALWTHAFEPEALPDDAG